LDDWVTSLQKKKMGIGKYHLHENILKKTKGEKVQNGRISQQQQRRSLSLKRRGVK